MIKLNKKNTKKILVSVFSGLATLCVAIGFSNSVKADEIDADFELIGALNESYSRGSYLELPNAYYKIDEISHEAELEVVFPKGGKMQYEEGKIQLNECGEYHLNYRIDKDGKIYIDTYTFSVVNDMSSMFLYESNVTAVNNASLPTYLGERSDKALPADHKQGKFWSSQETGVKFTLEKSSEPITITYDGVIDLSKLNYSNDGYSNNNGLRKDTDEAIVEFLFTPARAGQKEVEEFQVILTDIYDPTNYLKIYFSYVMDEGVTNVKVAPKDLYDPVATCASANGWVTGTLGTFAHSTMDGRMGDWNGNSISLFYDYADNEMNLHSIGGNTWPLMLAFEKEEEIGVGNAWHGFTTGEVYLSFCVENILGNEMSFTVLDIAGNTISDDYQNLKDVRLYVADQKFDSAYDYIVAGEDRYFDVFDAVAFVDGYGEVSVSKRVLYGENKETVPLRNGRFNVKQPGLYTIEYFVRTPYGVSEKEVYVTAKASADAKDEIRYTVSKNIPTEGVFGETIFLYEGKLSGGIGEVKTDYSVYVNGKNVDIDYTSIYPSFKLEEIGEYEITFTLQDEMGAVLEKKATVECVLEDDPQIILPTLPKFFLKNHTYVLPQADARYCTEDGEQSLTVKTTVNGQDVTGFSYTATSNFSLQYVVYLGTQVYYSEIIPCKVVEEKTGTSYISSYFYKESESSILTMERNGLTLMVADANADNGGFWFVNSISELLLNVQYELVDGANNYGGIEFTLIDSVNTNEVIKLAFIKEKIGSYTYTMFSLNGKKVKNVSGSLASKQIQYLGFTYDAKTFELTDVDGEFLTTLSHFENGMAFDGFSSGYVYASIRFLNVYGESKITVNKLASQVYTSSVEEDSAGPRILLQKEMAVYTYYEKGSTVVFPSAIAYDNFNSVASIRLVIKNPNNVEIYNGDISTEYAFAVEEYGTYNAYYEAVDTSSGKKVSRSRFYVNSISKEAPIITLGEYKTKVKVGQTYTIAQATTSTEATITAYIETAEDYKYYVNDGTFVFKKAGVYEVRYYAVDKYGNFTLSGYTVEVI